MHFDIINQEESRINYKAVYIGNNINTSKTIIFIDMRFKWYDRSHHARYIDLSCSTIHGPKSKVDDIYWPCGACDNFDRLKSWSLDRIVITYDDHTYLEIPNRMIKAMISEKKLRQCRAKARRNLTQRNRSQEKSGRRKKRKKGTRRERKEREEKERKEREEKERSEKRKKERSEEKQY